MNDLLKQELRSGWLGIDNPYQPLDFLGAALGSYFIWNAVTGKGEPWVNIALGSIMVFIHTKRFFFAPSDREGLIRLLQQLDVTPEEISGQLRSINNVR